MMKANEFRNSSAQHLSGFWLFKTDPGRVGEVENWAASFPEECEQVPVPSCWNNLLGKFDYCGAAWYNTSFYAPGGNIKILFEGVSNSAKVYFDGEYLGSHYGAFTSFSFIKKVEEGMHTITVMADNELSKDSIPGISHDWFCYGGIIRDVTVTALPDFFVDNMTIRYELTADLKSAAVTAEIDCFGDGEKEYSLYSNGVFIKKTFLKSGVNELCFDMTDIIPWDILKPTLYTFTLDGGDDRLSQRTGFRKVSVCDNMIHINNKPVFIKGVNRHEDHPDWGHAVPLHLMKRDIDIILHLGCNTVRGSHYPNSQAFLDLCDENGLLFWSELPLWQFKAGQVGGIVTDRAKIMGEEMVSQSINHPCIFTWGLHNECETEFSELSDISKTLFSMYKKLDPSRLVTYATDRPLTDICYDYCDFISINKYIGWYGGAMSDWDSFFDDIEKYLHSGGYGYKPVIVSESGAGGIFGEDSFEAPIWSETFQKNYLEDVLGIYKRREIISGVIIWQYCDIRVNAGRAMYRPRSFNNKGLVNEYRKPKAAYHKVREIFKNM